MTDELGVDESGGRAVLNKEPVVDPFKDLDDRAVGQGCDNRGVDVRLFAHVYRSAVGGYDRLAEVAHIDEFDPEIVGDRDGEIACDLIYIAREPRSVKQVVVIRKLKEDGGHICLVKLDKSAEGQYLYPVGQGIDLLVVVCEYRRRPLTLAAAWVVIYLRTPDGDGVRVGRRV